MGQKILKKILKKRKKENRVSEIHRVDSVNCPFPFYGTTPLGGFLTTLKEKRKAKKPIGTRNNNR